MTSFTEADVLAGKIVSPKSRLRIRVNKATGVNPTVGVGGNRSANADGVPLLGG